MISFRRQITVQEFFETTYVARSVLRGVDRYGQRRQPKGRLTDQPRTGESAPVAAKGR